MAASTAHQNHSRTAEEARIVFLGMPGSGKGTQAGYLSTVLDKPHVASGDLFQRHQEQGTKLGLMVKRYMEQGELVPDDVTIKMILNHIGEKDHSRGFILDGFPRTVGQATALDEALSDSAVDCVLYLKVSREELVHRLGGRLICQQCQTPYHRDGSPPQVEGRCNRCSGKLSQRADDRSEVVQRRIQVQREQLDPLLGYYSKQGKLVEINGEQSIDLVSEEMVEEMEKALSQDAMAT